jgi:lysophospholipase L1-like esterase
MMRAARLGFRLQLLRRLVVGIVLVYVAVILTVGGTMAARPVLYGSLGLWLVILAAATKWSTLDRFHIARPHWLDIAATNLALTLVLAELVLQALAACLGDSILLHATIDAHRLRPGHDYGGGLVGNRLGYPGAELSAARTPGVMRIAALGDSFAVGPAVPFADNYLTRLADQAGVEVGNFGVSGAGPREYRAILEQDVRQVQPDLVLVSIFVGNDITETLPQPRHLDPRRHALYLFGQRALYLVRERFRNEGEPPARGQGMSPETFREVEARRLAVCVKEPSPALEKKWQRTLEDLERIIAGCRQRGVPVAVVLIPDEFQVNAAVLGAALQEAGLAREQIDLDLPQRRLLEFFAQRGVPCLDLLPAFRTVPDTYAPRDTHWNVRGNHLAARHIAEWLPKAKG